jgi:hypothetical protein
MIRNGSTDTDRRVDVVDVVPNVAVPPAGLLFKLILVAVILGFSY